MLIYLTASLSILLLLFTACDRAGGTIPTEDSAPAATAKILAKTITPRPTALSGPAGRVSATATVRPTEAISATPMPTLDVEAQDLQGLTIRFWYVRPATIPTDAMAGLVRSFNAANPWGVVVTTTAFNNYGELAEAVQGNLYAGTLPDVILAAAAQGASWDERGGGVLVDLGLYVNEPLWGLSTEEKADFLPVFWQAGRFAEELLAVPFSGGAVALLYNITWAGELGYERPPVSAQGFAAQACAAARGLKRDDSLENDGEGGLALAVGDASLAGWIYAFGGEIAAADGRGYRLDTELVAEAAQFLFSLRESGCLWLLPEADPSQAFAGRRALFVVGSVAALERQRQAFAAAGNDDAWTVIAFPSPSDRPALIASGPGLMIVQSEPERQLAGWVFVEWLISAQTQADWVQSAGGLPSRTSALELLETYASRNPQWAALAALLGGAHAEPPYPSWAIVRWVLADAQAQLLAPGFMLDGLADWLAMLEATAAEVDGQVR